jgi:RNA polymerase sigma-70 factor (ECF subfamily)
MLWMGEKQSPFEELFLPHLAAAYNLAFWIVGRDADAEDVVQEAYLKALKGFNGFRGTNARSWLLSIVRNAAYSWARKNSKDSNVIPFDEELHTPAWDERLSPSHLQDRINQLQAALALLPAEFREILLLRDIEGWSYKELASILNVPAGTVMSRLSRARQRLRQELAKAQGEELQNEL